MIRQAISFFTGTTGTFDPHAERIVSMNGVAMHPLITLARLVTRGSFSTSAGSSRITNGEPISGSQRGVPDIFMVNRLLRSVIISRKDSTDWTFCFPMTGPFPRISPWSAIIRKPHQDQALCPPVLKPPAGILQHVPVIHAGEDDRRRIDINRTAEPFEDRERGLRARVVHVLLPEFRVGGKDREGDLRKAVSDEKIGNRRVIPALPARVPDMERGFRAAEPLDEILKLRVTAGSPPPLIVIRSISPCFDWRLASVSSAMDRRSLNPAYSSFTPRVQ